MAVRMITSIENHHHQEPPPSPRACPRASTWLPIHRALRERRALRRASHLAVAQRPGMGSPSCSGSSINPSLAAELQRSSLARRRAFVAAAHKFCTKQQQLQQLQLKQQQQQQQQQMRAWPALSLLSTAAIATPPPPAAATALADAATVLPRPAATPIVPVQDNSKVNPEIYFVSLLEKRGRAVTKKISSQEAGYVKELTAKQVLDYHSRPFLSDLVRKGDIDGLRKAVEAGREMNASNKFGESLVHVACRRGNVDVLRFLLENGGSLTDCDDLGRFPLHEVCWAVSPRFDIVRLFLDGKRRPSTTTSAAASPNGIDNSDENNSDNNDSNSNNNNNNNEELNPLLVTDKRGCTPLRYVKEESWPLWRQFLDEVIDEYWPSLV